MALKDRYKSEIVPALKAELKCENIFEVPRLEKIVVNIGVGDTTQTSKLMDVAIQEITAITGQKPSVTRAKKSVAGFKVREGMPIGLKVTLRGDRMYDFLEKLTGIVLPRIRDFRGINPNAFDGAGNYNLGLTDQLVFPEINYDKVQRMRGMNITMVTSAKTDMEARALLEQLGFPFRKSSKSNLAEGAQQYQAQAS
jgi:large subunit ribosomal protein L5